ncbi:MAG: prepilin-type N-terminal cleavage/methylation domain-containing protein [Lachnospiraceae bacterium]|nr:prepilin-type N-terminal cleavage/methylation domain-containing protein [Lachnospiraceae bacterium]
MNKRKLNNKGMTLVELIVTFALLGLFMVAAGKVIADTVNLYYKAKSIQTGMQVSSILSTKISGEIEGALTDGTLDSSSDAVIIISEDGNKIELIDNAANHIYITNNVESGDDAGYLLIYYFPIVDDEDNPSTASDSKWTFDKKAYMGYKIKELKFKKLENLTDTSDEDYGKYAGNIIRMTLTLTSERYGDYTTTTYIECYNFVDLSDTIRIIEN